MYDGNEAIWDAVLKELNLPLTYQPAVARILLENRWETARDHNHKAYIATAAARQALSMRLLDLENREFIRISGSGGRSGEDDAGDGREEKRISQQDDSDGPFPRVAELAADDYHGSLVQEFVPEDLHSSDPDADTDVDWRKVGARVALKPAMADSIGTVLDLRARGITRETAVRQAKTDLDRQRIQAAWRWVDRNWDSRVKPALRGLELSQRRTSTDRAAITKRAFVPPGEALKGVLQRQVRPTEDWVCSPSIDRPWNLNGFGKLVFHQDRIDGYLDPANDEADRAFLMAFDSKHLRRNVP